MGEGEGVETLKSKVAEFLFLDSKKLNLSHPVLDKFRSFKEVTFWSGYREKK